MSSKFVRNRSCKALFLAIISIFLCVNNAQAEDWKGYGYFKIGGNSHIVDSAVDSNVIFGFGGGYLLYSKCHFYVDPSLTLHWPKHENIGLAEGTGVRLSYKTLLGDLNGSYTFTSPSSKSPFVPYLTGGIGFLRNSISASDRYNSYGGDSTASFTKNVGSGVRVMMGSGQHWFLGGEFKNHWAAGHTFRVITGGVGFSF